MVREKGKVLVKLPSPLFLISFNKQKSFLFNQLLKCNGEENLNYV